MRTKDENKEKAIRQAAIEMIVKVGFDGLSMQKLAKKAGVSPATIYLYFANREDLLNKLYIEVRDRIHKASLENFDPNLDFASGMKLMWTNRFNYLTTHKDDHYFFQNFVNSPLMHGVVNFEDKTMFTVMNKFLTNAINNNEIESLPFEIYWPVAFSPLYQLIYFHLEGHKGKKIVITEIELFKVLEMVLKGLKK